MNSFRGGMHNFVGTCIANFELDLSRSKLELNDHLVIFNEIIHLFSYKMDSPSSRDREPKLLSGLRRGVGV